MDDPNRPGLFAGGYFVVHCRTGQPPWMPEHLVVRRAISADPQLVPTFPTPSWANDFEVLVRRFGLDSSQGTAAGSFADALMADNAFGWPNVFFEVSDATTFRQSYASGRDDVVVIGIGLPEARAERLAAELDAAQRRFGVRAGPSGVSERLARREPLANGGTALGYELLAMDVPPFESWVVNGLPQLVHDRLGISVNEDGLIASLDEACQAADFISRPDVPSEPYTWDPWLIIEYA